jgi:hypothetical protein
MTSVTAFPPKKQNPHTQKEQPTGSRWAALLSGQNQVRASDPYPSDALPSAASELDAIPASAEAQDVIQASAAARVAAQALDETEVPDETQASDETVASASDAIQAWDETAAEEQDETPASDEIAVEEQDETEVLPHGSPALPPYASAPKSAAPLLPLPADHGWH